TTHSSLDINSIMNAARFLSGEIELDKLLNKLMIILFEVVGAEKGSLLFVDKDDTTGEDCLFVEAEGDVNKQENTILSHTPIHLADYPATIINYVSRAKKFVVLDDASFTGEYTQDVYIQAKQPKSILCYPVANQGKLIALIYLENNLTTNIFNQERLDIMAVIASQLAISMENVKLLNRIVAVTEEKARVGMAMEIARDMQTCLLPTRPQIDGFDITTFMQTCDEVGGDYYDVFSYGGFDWLIIGDVSGHGVKSGMVMMMVQVAIHTAMRYYNSKQSLEDVLQKVNNVVTNNISMMQADKYMTLTILLVEKNKLYYAGLHQPIIIYRAAEDKVEQLKTEGSWLGYEEMMNDYPTMSFTMNSGDTLILYTDGVSEAVDKDDKMFDDSGIRNFMQRNGTCTTKQMRKLLIEKLKDYKNEDDITFVFVKKL
ncbi:MAG: SpoIIE family protein phosphatase, partial [Spirochaetota bacterium]